MKKIKLDNQEIKLEKALEKGDFIKASGSNITKNLFKEAAENYQELQKSKRITIRVNQEDLIKVKVKAKKNNMPYQTLLNSLIHQFADGQTVVRI
jgi:predicted DNA binding CopG/RHH family protein